MTVVSIRQAFVNIGAESSVAFVAGIARTIEATQCIGAICIHMTVVSIRQAFINVDAGSSVAG